MTDKLSTREPVQSSSVELVMRMVADPSCDPAKLREFLAVRKEWMAEEAAKAFNGAMVSFQTRAPVVSKLDDNEGKKYARMERIWGEVRPLMHECGLAITWNATRLVDGVCVMDGYIRHASGHAEAIHYETPMPEPVRNREGKAVQNAAQVFGVAATYCQRRATCAVLGIQVGRDTDGTVLPRLDAVALIDNAQRRELAAAFRASGMTSENYALVLRDVAGVDETKDIPADKFAAVMAAMKPLDDDTERLMK